MVREEADDDMKGFGIVVVAAIGALLVVGLAAVPIASAGANVIRTESFWGDGILWGSAVTPAALPSDAPASSFDRFFVTTNSNNPMGQLPVAEAAPGNPAYNGGRWVTYTVTWTNAAFADHGIVPVLTSLADIEFHAGIGHLTVIQGSPSGGPPPYFECPLIPATA